MEQIKLITLKTVEELKRKIDLKQSELCNIRASKSDFAYQYSQSILKIINSLNMEIMDMQKKELSDEFKFKKLEEEVNIEKIQQYYLKGILVIL